MTISAAMVKELRERTGAGMMDCKRALTESNGDIEAAIEAMRKAGQAKADKKAGRVAAEGVIVAKINGNKAVMVEINSETDFVARDENFTQFADKVVNALLASDLSDNDIDGLSALLVGEETVEQARQALVSKIGENIKVRRFIQVTNDNGSTGQYIHGSRIGVLAVLKGGDESLAKDIAMHVAASKPLVVNRDQVSEDVINKEREIFSAQAQESGKPQEIIDKMIGGRINKFLDEVSLLGQAFVKDPNQKVGQLLKSNNADVINFIRYEVGEGIEKKEDNFVEEVMAQVRDA